MKPFFQKIFMLSVVITAMLHSGSYSVYSTPVYFTTGIQKDSIIPKTNPFPPDSLNWVDCLLKRDSSIKLPVFKHGSVQLWVTKHMIYPKDAIINWIEGKVYVNFVINTDGSISEATILRGICPSLDAEAKRVVLSMPAWEPGYQKGKPIRVSHTLPINFQLSKKQITN